MAASALKNGGSEARKQTWLARIVAGAAVISAAIDESARHDPTRIETTATRTPRGWRLDGGKIGALDGAVADAFLVAAKAEGEVGLYLVEARASGLSCVGRTLVDGRRVAALRFENVAAPADAKLCGGGALIAQVLDVARGALAASLCGIAEEAFARTLDYLKQRKQFDRTIGSFQALQHRVAVMHVSVENAWSATLKALQALDSGSADAPLQIAMAKAKAGETGRTVAAECLQLHGGIGMTDEFDIGLFLKKARVDAELFGDPAYHADRVATMLGY